MGPDKVMDMAEDAVVTPDAPAEPGAGEVLDNIAPEPAAAADPWALPEDADTFDRETVERYVTQGRDLHEKFGSLDFDEVQNGLHIMEALQTPEGIREFFIEAGKALGITEQQAFALLSGQQLTAAVEATAPAEPEYDPEELMTRAQFEEALNKRVLEPQQLAEKQAADAAAVAQATQAIRQVVDTELGLGGDQNKAERDIVLAIADGLTDPNERDARRISEAIRTAHKQWKAQQEQAFNAYVADKTKAAQTVPKTFGSNTGGAGDTTEEAPKSLQEAIERRRKGKAGI